MSVHGAGDVAGFEGLGFARVDWNDVAVVEQSSKILGIEQNFVFHISLQAQGVGASCPPTAQ
jgi:hypothetical protein